MSAEEGLLSRVSRPVPRVAMRDLAHPRVAMRDLAQTTDVLEHALHPDADDALHRVIADPVLLAVVEDGHDVRVVQLGRRAGFGLKSAHIVEFATISRVHDLERHAGLERLVLGLIDDPHAAASKLAEQRVIAQASQAVNSARRPDDGADRLRQVVLFLGLWLEPFEQFQRGEQFEDSRGMVGVLSGICGDIEPLATTATTQVVLHQSFDRVQIPGRSIAVHRPPPSS